MMDVLCAISLRQLSTCATFYAFSNCLDVLMMMMADLALILLMIDLDDDDGGLGVDLADQCEGQVRGRAQHLLRHRCWQARVI